MRGAPQRGLAVLIFRISSRTSRFTAGLPAVPRRLFHVQYSRNPLRCQAITVSGFTTSNAKRQFRQKRERQTQNIRSAELRRGRPLRPFQECELVTESENLDLKRCPSPKPRSQAGKRGKKERGKHREVRYQGRLLRSMIAVQTTYLVCTGSPIYWVRVGGPE
jgi:hypothetical protein